MIDFLQESKFFMGSKIWCYRASNIEILLVGFLSSIFLKKSINISLSTYNYSIFWSISLKISLLVLMLLNKAVKSFPFFMHFYILKN